MSSGLYQKLIRRRAACATRWGNPSRGGGGGVSAGLINLSRPDDVPLIRLGVHYRYPNTQTEAVFAPPPSGGPCPPLVCGIIPPEPQTAFFHFRPIDFVVFSFFFLFITSREKTIVSLVRQFQLYVVGEIILYFVRGISSSHLI